MLSEDTPGTQGTGQTVAFQNTDPYAAQGKTDKLEGAYAASCSDAGSPADKEDNIDCNPRAGSVGADVRMAARSSRVTCDQIPCSSDVNVCSKHLAGGSDGSAGRDHVPARKFELPAEDEQVAGLELSPQAGCLPCVHCFQKMMH